MNKDDDLSKLGMHAGALPVTFQRARLLRGKETPQELVMWSYLRLKPYGYKFRRQHPFDIYILDFYCHELRLCVEIDGRYHMTKAVTIEKDKRRKDLLKFYGVLTIRFSNEEVDNDIEAVLNRIVKVIRKRKDGRANLPRP